MKRTYNEAKLNVPYYMDPRHAPQQAVSAFPQGGFVPHVGIPPRTPLIGGPWLSELGAAQSPPSAPHFVPHLVPQLRYRPPAAIYYGAGGGPAPMRGRVLGKFGLGGFGRGGSRHSRASIPKGHAWGRGESAGSQSIERFFKETFLDPDPWRNLRPKGNKAASEPAKAQNFKVEYQLEVVSPQKSVMAEVSGSSEVPSSGIFSPATKGVLPIAPTASKPAGTEAEVDAIKEAPVKKPLGRHGNGAPLQTKIHDQSSAGLPEEMSTSSGEASADLYSLFQSFR